MVPVSDVSESLTLLLGCTAIVVAAWLFRRILIGIVYDQRNDLSASDAGDANMIFTSIAVVITFVCLVVATCASKPAVQGAMGGCEYRSKGEILREKNAAFVTSTGQIIVMTSATNQ